MPYLMLDDTLNTLSVKKGNKKEVRDSLSASIRVGEYLFVASDEVSRLDRFTLRPDGNYDNHVIFPLTDFLTLPGDPLEEADLESLDYEDGYLYIIGSHSLKRGKPSKGNSNKENRDALAAVSLDGNRCLLARVPLVVTAEGPIPVKRDGNRFAGSLWANERSSELTNALKDDPHLGPFFKMTGKDNGFDIEGLAVCGDRVHIGLRGPVLRGWAILLDVTVIIGKKGELRLKSVEKRFLDLNGLGVRDLCFSGDDLLILAGPTMNLDGPTQIFRWKNAVMSNSEFVFGGTDTLTVVAEVPFGKGDDHAEGMASMPENPDAVLVFYDSPAEIRHSHEEGNPTLTADLIQLCQ